VAKKEVAKEEVAKEEVEEDRKQLFLLALDE